MSKNKVKWKLSSVLFGLLGSIVVAAFPALFMFFQNAGEAHFSDIVPVTVGFMAAGVILYGIALLLTRKPAKAGLITFLFLLVFLNYAPIEKLIQMLFPELRYWHIAPILLVILLHFSWAICSFLPDDITDLFTPIITVVFCALIIINGAPKFATIQARINSEKKSAKESIENTQEGAEMPNIYFLMFDEYSSYDFMKKYYDYDNKEFLERLKNDGFSISYGSHNESVRTSTVVANLMNLEYIVDDSWEEYRKSQVRMNGRLYSLLQEHGYRLYSLTESYGLPLLDQTLDTGGRRATVSGDTLGDVLLKNTVAYPLVNKKWNALRPTLDIIENYICSGEKSRFLVAHLNITHAPFIYDRDGNISNNINSNWVDKQFYLNQYIFATKVMDELVECILENDPNSIIIIQSDHGARASTDMSLYKVMFSLEDMSNIFNCVYYPGELLNIEGLSGVNTERLVYGKLLDVVLPQIPVPPTEG